ncbi:MAG: hypothetical protein CMH55_02155 [Myxococcales bacterium]|nr:hypothetical protein [Myxococcales bacterium]
MLKTQLYRGRQMAVKSMVVEVQETESYYPTRRYRFTDFSIEDTNSGQTLLSCGDLALGSRSVRWDSWTAWDDCGFFALLGDFILYYVTAPAMMDSSDGTCDLKAIYLVDAAEFQPDAEEITASMHLLHDFEDDGEKEVHLGGEFISLNHWTMHANAGSAGFSEVPSAGTHAPGGGEIPFDLAQCAACGGAALVKIKGSKRWLVPHADGPAAALARVLETDPAADWSALSAHLENASATERDRVRAHFLALGDGTLSAQVTEALGAGEASGE